LFFICFNSILINNLEIDIEESSQTSTINDFFNKSRSLKRPKSPVFDVVQFKSLLLNFAIANNISFRAVTSISFKKLLDYLTP
jgi:hypothetical protein